MTWIQPGDQASSSSHQQPALTVATNYRVDVMMLHERESSCSYDLLELHNIIDAPVTCIDARLDPFHVVVGFTLNTGPAQYFRVRLLDLPIIMIFVLPHPILIRCMWVPLCVCVCESVCVYVCVCVCVHACVHVHV